jgi:hypothetical protein
LARIEGGKKRLPRDHQFWGKLHDSQGMGDREFWDIIASLEDPSFAQEHRRLFDMRVARSSEDEIGDEIPNLIPDDRIPVSASVQVAEDGPYLELSVYMPASNDNPKDRRQLTDFLVDLLRVGLSHWQLQEVERPDGTRESPER